MFVNKINTNIIKQSEVSFNGHNLEENDYGEKVYKFFLPKVYYDNAKLQIQKFKIDLNGNIEENPQSDVQTFDIPKDRGTVEINAKDLKLSKNEVVGYKFIIDNQEFLDTHKFTVTNSGQKYNIADSVSSDVLKMPRTMYHLMPNTFNPKNKPVTTVKNALGETVVVDEDKVRANHITKFDVSLNSIIEKIPYIKKMGFNRIISTPIFGQDNISTHGYWTTNPYQLTSRLGNINDFKNLQIELFKNGMGFVADGAFTGEGIEGIHIRDIIEHGTKSHFLDFFETFDFPSEALKFGVLPDMENAYQNFDIRVVNSPVIWSVDKYGQITDDFGKKNPDYDSKKRTFIQLYDKRLTSENQLKNDKLIRAYDIKNPVNVNDINNWMDTVQPFAFPVPAKEVINKATLAKENKYTEAKEFLRNWENFELVQAKQSGGIKLLTGDKDILKLRYIYPTVKRHHTINEADTIELGQRNMEKIQDITHKVRDYTIGVGEYWTNKTSKILNEYIVSQIKDAKTSQEIAELINNKAGKELPSSVKKLNITAKNIQDVIDNKNPISNYIPYPETIAEMFDDCPIESVECSDEIISLVTSHLTKNRLERYGIIELFKNAALDILEHTQELGLACEKLIENDDLSPKNYKVARFIEDDIKAFLFIKSLVPNFSVSDIVNHNIEKIQDISLKGIGVISETRNEKASQIVSLMKQNIKKIPDEDIDEFAKYLNAKIKNTTPEKIDIADYIIDKTESGLEWRIDASKDITEVEELMEDDASVEETWGKFIEFWGKFNEGVRNYNRHAYKVGELTDTTIRFDDISEKFKNTGDLEEKLIANGKFTTSTNYNYLFSTLQKVFSAMTEEGDANYYGDVNWLLTHVLKAGDPNRKAFLYSGPKNGIVFSHVSADNHDRQRIAHGFSVNAGLAYNKNTNLSDYYLKEEILNEGMKNSKYREKLIKSFNNGQTYNDSSLAQDISKENLAMEAALAESFHEALKQEGLDLAYSKDFVKALDNMASKGSPYADMFYHKNFETNYRETVDYMIKNKLVDNKFKEIAERLEPVVHKEFTKYAYIRGKELAKLMVALPGNPTLFAGDELLETGSESKAKNVYLQNRNKLHWNYLQNPKYSHVQNYQQALSKIFNLRNDKDLSCLTNGDTIVLGNQQGSTDGNAIFGLYRYNDENDAIILIQKQGFGTNRRCGNEKDIQREIDYIDFSQSKFNPWDHQLPKENNLTDKEKIILKETSKLGLPKNLKEGSRFIDALHPENKYVIKNGKLHGIDGQRIKMTGSVLILKREV